MRKDRLLKLADYLETVPRDRFDMTTWGIKSGCGFAGCAMGWASHGKLFRGLTIELNDIGGDIIYTTGKGTWANFRAASELFGIPYGDADELFAPAPESGAVQARTPKQVAKRIRKFVASSLPASGGK